jgi:hypothetical protein
MMFVIFKPLSRHVCCGGGEQAQLKAGGRRGRGSDARQLPPLCDDQHGEASKRLRSSAMLEH